MNKIKLILILCLTFLNSDDMTSSCKDFKHKQCLKNNWKFEDSDQKDAMKNYELARDNIQGNKLTKAYEHIVKARDIIQGNQIINSKMKKNIYSGSALRPRVKIYKTEIKNIYDIELLELNVSSQNTALPLLVVECGKNISNIHLYNINKSIKDNKKINNMNMGDIDIMINDKSYTIDKVKSGEKTTMKANIKNCKNLNTSLKANNYLFDEKSISQVLLFKKGM